MTQLLKGAKIDHTKVKGSSTLIVSSPSTRSINNYMNLLTQLGGSRNITNNVQQKIEARYIAKHSIRNAVSHIIAVAVSHYLIGTPDPRLKSIEKAE